METDSYTKRQVEARGNGQLDKEVGRETSRRQLDKETKRQQERRGNGQLDKETKRQTDTQPADLRFSAGLYPKTDREEVVS